MPTALLQTELPLPGKRRGKVRDVYDAQTTAGEPVVLMVATDRLSAFDVVMPTGVPGKGQILTAISAFWFAMIGRELRDRLSHHLLSTDVADVAGLSQREREQLAGRVMLGRRCRVVPIECVVRGYLAGSGWAEYRSSGTVCGIELPAGLKQCEQLPEPIFTPATKAAEGHDQNITFEQACAMAGDPLMRRLRDLSLAIYQLGHDYARQHGIILADTKFEFGLPVDGEEQPILIDEVMTPDSSRFWPAEDYAPGRDQASFDKQFVRNYLQALVDAGSWDKQPPGPELPREVVQGTVERYRDAAQRLGVAL
jgi:phosphoribosylaminoimidazole-succinocarboxamide synthase